MSDSNPLPADDAHAEPPHRQKSVGPLTLALLLLALLALCWWLYTRNGQPGSDAATAPAMTDTVVTSSEEDAAKAEREQADATAQRREARAAEAKRDAAEARKKRAANREVTPVTRVQPDYPPAAYRAGDEGTVLLRVNVDAGGKPERVEVIRRSGSRELDRAAQRAVQRWTFKPALKNGKAVAAVAEVPVEFKLDR